MSTRRSEDSASIQPGGYSRRDVVVRLGAGGVAVALLARGRAVASAQEGTPPAGGLPEGVSVTPLINIPVPDVPTGPFTISLARVTLEPGASVPESTVTYPEIAYVEAGNLTCPGSDGRWVYAPDGTVTASGAGDLPVPAGSGAYFAPNSVDGARNDGTEQLSVLLIGLVPSEDMGTPSS